jgi:GTPase KRas
MHIAKNVRVDNEIATLEILDTSGQEEFSTLRSQWMKSKDGFIFVYSLDQKSTLEALYPYIDLLEQATVEMRYIPPVAFVGNKKDVVDREPEKRR